MCKFNTKVSLSANIRCGLWCNQLTLDDMSEAIGIKVGQIRTSISRKFKRGNSISPQDKKMIEYLRNNCKGFEEYCKTEKLLQK